MSHPFQNELLGAPFHGESRPWVRRWRHRGGMGGARPEWRVLGREPLRRLLVGSLPRPCLLLRLAFLLSLPSGVLAVLEGLREQGGVVLLKVGNCQSLRAPSVRPFKGIRRALCRRVKERALLLGLNAEHVGNHRIAPVLCEGEIGEDGARLSIAINAGDVLIRLRR